MSKATNILKNFNFETKIMLESEIIESDYLSKINTSIITTCIKTVSKIYITGIILKLFR